MLLCPKKCDKLIESETGLIKKNMPLRALWKHSGRWGRIDMPGVYIRNSMGSPIYGHASDGSGLQFPTPVFDGGISADIGGSSGSGDYTDWPPATMNSFAFNTPSCIPCVT